MDLVLRPPNRADVSACGRVLYAAFQNIAERHNFPPDFASVEGATQVAAFLVNQRSFFGVVAELGGRIVGSNFMAERDPIYAIGPISVDPDVQERGVGRRLMLAAIERGRNAAGIRLVQDAFNMVSMSLYASLGFEIREPLVLIGGRPRSRPAPGVTVRPLRRDDLDACAALCRRIHGFERTNELRDAMTSFAPAVAVRDQRIVAYATTLEVWQVAHAVAESESDLTALILGVAAASPRPLAFLLPTRQTTLFHWCLAERLRVVKPLTLMTMRAYREPTGSYLPSVAY